jgi:PIN domain-containing protein
MRDRFFGYYQPSEEELSNLWRECTFVLDANVLLNLYRYPDKARDDLIKALEAVRDRVWIPHYAALEYQRNRPGVVAGQKARFGEVKQILSSVIPDLERELAGLELEKRHSSINVKQLVDTLRKNIYSYIESLSVQERMQKGVHQGDPIRDKLDSCLTIGAAPTSQAELDSLLEGAEERFKHRMPPGYLDEGKDKEKEPLVCYGGLVYRRKLGDLLVWKQIISYAKQEKKRAIIFVTDDDKEDWWFRIHSQGPKTLGPRPELVEEIRREAGVDRFYMYASERFLKYATQELKLDIATESISQVADVRATSTRAMGFYALGAQQAFVEVNIVRKWLKSKYENLRPFGTSSIDYFATRSSGKRVGIAVAMKSLAVPFEEFLSYARETISAAHSAVSITLFDDVHVIVVIREQQPAGSYPQIAFALQDSSYDHTYITIGVIEKMDQGEGVFEPKVTVAGQATAEIDLSAFL